MAVEPRDNAVVRVDELGYLGYLDELDSLGVSC